MILSLPRWHQGLGFHMTGSAIDLVDFTPYGDRSDDQLQPAQYAAASLVRS